MNDHHHNNNHGWSTRDELAKLLGLQPARIDELRKLLPEDAWRRDGRRVLIRTTAAVRMWYDRQQVASGARRRADRGAGDDPTEPEAGDSPALERLRAAKASIEELNLAKRRGELVEVADLRRAIAVVIESAKLLSARLQQRHGAAAAGAFNEWLETAATAVASAAEDGK